MANFPIERARERLGFTPTTAVRADIDVRTGGGELAEAVSGFGGALVGLGLQIRRKREEMTDATSSVQAQNLRDTATLDFETFKLTNPQETWEDFRKKQAEEIGQQITELPFSDRERTIQQAKSIAYTDIETARALTDATRQLRTDTIDALTESLTAAFRSGDPARIAEATKRYIDNGANMGKDKVEVLSDIKAAKAAGDNLASGDAANAVHAAIEAASDPATGGNFSIARELAKNPVIPESQQATLRNAIHAAEKRRNTLISTAPINSNPFAAGRVRRAKTDFDMGAINRAEADRIVLENYEELDAEAREKIFSDLEDVEAKIIAVAKSNAYDEGRGLMSQRFVGIQSEEDLIDLFRGAGLTEEEKKRINRRWTAEVNNRDLYERAVDERFVEMRKEGISASSKYKSESLEILLQYQRKKQLGLEELEAEVRREQQQRRPFIGPPIPVIKPVSEMTMEEKQRELERIRELKRR